MGKGVVHRLDYTNESGISLPSRNPAADSRQILETHSTPPGFPPSISGRDVSNLYSPDVVPVERAPDSSQQVKEAYKAAWRTAFSPVRSLLTSALIVFMTGSSVQVFSVMTCITILLMQLQSLTSVCAIFGQTVKEEPALKGKLVPQVLVYVALCTVGIAGALYQCQRLGFLPTTESDWIGLLPVLRLNEVPIYRGGLSI